MKSKFILLTFIGLIGATLFMSNSGGRAKIGHGNTGAPGDAAGCFASSCHAATGAFGASTMIQVNDLSGNPVTAYVPGTTYRTVVTISTTSTPAGYGFQIVSLFNSDDSDVAGWSNPGTDVQIETASMTGRSYAEHDKTSSTNTFEVDWTAPAAGSGSVDFYAAGNAVNGNMNFIGDDPTNATLTLTEDTNISSKDIESMVSLSIQPNPVVDFINLEINSVDAGDFNLELVDFSGRILKTENIRLEVGSNRLQYAASDLNTGLYILRISNGEAQLVQTLFKK